MMSLHEMQGCVIGAYVILKDVIARERWAGGWESRVEFNCVLGMSKRSGASILAGECTVIREKGWNFRGLYG